MVGIGVITAVGRVTEITEIQIPDFKIEINIRDKKAYFILPEDHRRKVGDPENFKNKIKKDLEKKLSHVSLIKINKGIALSGGYSIGPLVFENFNDNEWHRGDVNKVVEVIKENFPTSYEVGIEITVD